MLFGWNQMRFICAREANRHVARLLDEAARGKEIVITRRGEPVAVLAPYRAPALTPEKRAAIERLLATMARGIGTGARRFAREDMHER